MEKTLSLEEFYRRHFDWPPSNLHKEIGHFNIFEIGNPKGPKGKGVSYSRKDFYKVYLLHGKYKIHYANQSINTDKSILLFINPNVPYGLERLDAKERTGFFCIFSEEFFHQSSHIKAYPLFKPGDTPLFNLSEEQAAEITGLFHKMQHEISSDFIYKYDAIRNLILDITITALKMRCATAGQYTDSNSTIRVSSLFTEILERQFPIESSMQRMKFRSPIDFANELLIHVNHLNRTLKKVTGKTTSQLIMERVIQEAKGLLTHTSWNVSEIAWCLGFEGAPYFITAFKKHTQVTPAAFRKEQHS